MRAPVWLILSFSGWIIAGDVVKYTVDLRDSVLGSLRNTGRGKLWAHLSRFSWPRPLTWVMQFHSLPPVSLITISIVHVIAVSSIASDSQFSRLQRRKPPSPSKKKKRLNTGRRPGPRRKHWKRRKRPEAQTSAKQMRTMRKSGATMKKVKLCSSFIMGHPSLPETLQKLYRELFFLNHLRTHCQHDAVTLAVPAYSTPFARPCPAQTPLPIHLGSIP